MQARLTTAVDGKQVGEILDDPLVWALCVPGVRGATPIAEPADDECRAKVDALVCRASRAIAATQQELRRLQGQGLITPDGRAVATGDTERDAYVREALASAAGHGINTLDGDVQ